MTQLITQKHMLGCGAACIAGALNISYDEVLGIVGSVKRGLLCREIVWVLKQFGITTHSAYIKKHIRKRIYAHRSIVFIARSKRYPYGHYLLRFNGQWMDPWINGPETNWDIKKARAGWRKRLPGRAIYCIY